MTVQLEVLGTGRMRHHAAAPRALGQRVAAPPAVDPMEAAPQPAEAPSDASTSVSKALQLLDAFRNATACLGVSDLSRRVGVPKSTAFRLLANLEQGGFVERVGTKYQLSWSIFELGNRVEMCKPKGLRDLALPFLSELYVASGRAVHLAVLDGADVVYLEKIHGHKAVRLPSYIGGRIPANCSSLGKAMLAFSDQETVMNVLRTSLPRRTQYSITNPGRLINQLHQIQAEGIAYDHEEVALGLTCVAAPVLRRGRAVAAVSVSAPTTGFSVDAYRRLVRTAAEGISEALAEN